MKTVARTLLVSSTLMAAEPGLILSHKIDKDFDLTADPGAAHWKNVPGVFAENGPQREPVPGHRTAIRSLWTEKNIYFLFTCPYETLYLKPNPSATVETNKLWEWDVAEVFIGSDFTNIRQYKEFQVSPQNEWVDLDIDRDKPKPEGGWLWNSCFRVKARIDHARKIWYGEMQIPLDKIDARPPNAGNEFRINLYRIQGPPPKRKLIAWQPTGQPNYHVPEAFGRLRLAGPLK